jgi:hypothetical protein
MICLEAARQRAFFLRNDGPHKVDDDCLDTGAGSEATRYLEMDHLQENKKEALGQWSPDGRQPSADRRYTASTGWESFVPNSI